MKKGSYAAIMVTILLSAAFVNVYSERNNENRGMEGFDDSFAYTYYWILGQLPNQTHVYIYAREGANVTFNGTVNAPVRLQIPEDQFMIYNIGDLGYTQTGTQWYFLEMTSDRPLMVDFDRVVNIRTGLSTYEDYHGDSILNKPPMELNETYYFPNAGSGARDDILVMYSHENVNATVRRFTNDGEIFTKAVNFQGLYVSSYISSWLGPSNPEWEAYGLKVVAEKPIAAALFDEIMWYPKPDSGSGYYVGFSGLTQLYDEYMHIHHTAGYDNLYILNTLDLTYRDEYGNLVGSPLVFGGETSTLVSHSAIGYDVSSPPYLVHLKGSDVFADGLRTPAATDITNAAAYMGWNSSMAQLEIYTGADTKVTIYNGRNYSIMTAFSMSANTIFTDNLDSLGFNVNEPFLAFVTSEVPVYQEVIIPYYLRQYPAELAPPVIPPPQPPFLYINSSHNGNDAVLFWDPPPSPEIDYYLIYRATSQTEFDFKSIWVNTSNDVNPLSGTINPLTLMWLDKNVTNASHLDYQPEYYYTIRAVNVNGLISTTSNTVGYYIMHFDTGMNTFSLPLQPQTTHYLDEFAHEMDAKSISWQEESDEWQTNLTDQAPVAKIGEGYVVVFDKPESYVFTGEPAAMIIYKEGFGFNETARDDVRATIEPSNAVSLSWTPVTGADKYYVYRSNIRHGFFTENYTIFEALSSQYLDLDVAPLKGEQYYLIVPYNITQGNGSSTYSIGVITEEYNGNEMFGLPLKPVWIEMSADWYIDQIPYCLGIVFFKDDLWIPHFKEFEEGVFNTIIRFGRGYQLTVYYNSLFTYIGW